MVYQQLHVLESVAAVTLLLKSGVGHFGEEDIRRFLKLTPAAPVDTCRGEKTPTTPHHRSAPYTTHLQAWDKTLAPTPPRSAQ